jgi:hypothetical protein
VMTLVGMFCSCSCLCHLMNSFILNSRL